MDIVKTTIRLKSPEEVKQLLVLKDRQDALKQDDELVEIGGDL